MLPAIYHLAHFFNVRFPPGNTCFQKIIIALMSGSGKQNEKKKTQTKTPNKRTNKQKAKANKSANKSVSLWLALYSNQSFVILDIF